MSTDISKEELIHKIEQSYDAFYSYIKTLNHHQLNEKKDNAGWNVKDFIIHVAVWENGIIGLLQNGKRSEAMGVPKEVFQRGNDDEINVIIRKMNQNVDDEVAKEKLRQTHNQVLNLVKKLTFDELLLPYNHFDQSSTRTEPVISRVIGNTFEHFTPHLRKIKNMVVSN